MTKSASKSVATRLTLVVVFAFSVGGQQIPNNDEEVKHISNLIDQAWKEVKTVGATTPGVARSDDSPGRKYSAILWQYHSNHPYTPAGSRAVVAALNLLVAVGDSDRAEAMSEQILPDDPAWDRVIQILWRESERKSDYAQFIEKAKAVLRVASERNIRTRAGIFLGQAYWKQSRLDLANAAFEEVVREAPHSEDGEWAKGNIYEITSLNPGQPSPPFDSKTVDGDRISLLGLRGRIVLLKFWASW
jgi:tetratricopeptide (TPR) repeat protein